MLINHPNMTRNGSVILNHPRVWFIDGFSTTSNHQEEYSRGLLGIPSAGADFIAQAVWRETGFDEL